jgi:hypothetical protein
MSNETDEAEKNIIFDTQAALPDTQTALSQQQTCALQRDSNQCGIGIVLLC